MPGGAGTIPAMTAGEIDLASVVPRRVQLAALLRERIRSGALPPGAAVPSGPALADRYGISRYTADRALDLLASEGLVRRVAGVGTIVTAAGQPAAVIDVGPGARITARLPGAGEAALSLPPGVAVLVIEQDGQTTVAPGDRTVIRTVAGAISPSAGP